MKRFSNVLYIVIGLVALLLIFAWFFYQKQNFKQQNELVNDSAQIQRNEGLVLTDSNFVLKQTEKPNMLVLGKSYKSKYSNLSKLISETAGPLMNTISKQKLIITGSIMSIYDQLPSSKGEMDIFIGIPVNKEIQGTEYYYKKIEGGKFHKITANTELGNGVSIWNGVKNRFETSGNKLHFPLIEYPSDSRNSEMTTALTQVNLLIPIK